MYFQLLYSPENEMELIFLRNLLDAANIDYFVRGEYFGSWLPGPQIEFYNRRYVYVENKNINRSYDIINRFTKERDTSYKLNLYDKLVIFFEFFVFMWFLPGHRRTLSQCIRNLMTIEQDFAINESEWLYDDGVEALEQGHYEHALNLFDSYLYHYPDDIDALFNIMCCFAYLGDKESAKHIMNLLFIKNNDIKNEVLATDELHLLHDFAKEFDSNSI